MKYLALFPSRPGPHHTRLPPCHEPRLAGDPKRREERLRHQARDAGHVQDPARALLLRVALAAAAQAEVVTGALREERDPQVASSAGLTVAVEVLTGKPPLLLLPEDP